MIETMGELSPEDIFVAFVGGAIAGLFLQAFHPHQPHYALRRTLLQAWVIGWLGLLFYLGRLVAAYVRGDPQAGWLVGALVLWALYTLAAAIGVYVGYRARQEWDGREEEGQEEHEEHDHNSDDAGGPAAPP